MEFSDFEVWIDPGQREEDTLVCPIRATITPTGPGRAKMSLPLWTKDFQDELSKVMGIDGTVEDRCHMGTVLFRALFADAVRDKWSGSTARVAGQSGLRVRLCIGEQRIANLPWELLYDQEREEFIASSQSRAFSRYLEVAEPPPARMEGPIGVLVVVEDPEGLGVKPEEVKRLEETLAMLGERFRYKTVWKPALDRLYDEIDREQFHVVHLMAHGATANGEHKVALAGRDGSGLAVATQEQLAQLFQGRHKVRLVVLNVCDSAAATPSGLFAGLAPALIKRQVPAVVAMQYPEVTQEAAGMFNKVFYTALGRNGEDVDVAVNSARNYLSAELKLGPRHWSTPVLYMATRNGQIFGSAVEGDGRVPRDFADDLRLLSLRASRVQEWFGTELRLADVAAHFESYDRKLKTLRRVRGEALDSGLDDLEYLLDHLKGALIKLKSFVGDLKHLRQALPDDAGHVPGQFVDQWAADLSYVTDVDPGMPPPEPDLEYYKRLRDSLKYLLETPVAECRVKYKRELDELVERCRSLVD